MRNIDENHFYLETPEPIAVGSAESCLTGWFMPAEDNGNVKLSVVVDGSPQPVLAGLTRPDVARHFGRPALKNCGFVARFLNPVVEPTVKLIAETPAGHIVLASVAVNPKPKSWVASNPKGSVSNYQEWLTSCEASLFWHDSEVSERLSALTYQPLISIILPIYNTDAYFLRCCVRSVCEQRYTNWQLCAVDDCSSDDRVVDYMESVAAQDARIHFTCRTKQGNISAASNSALEYARGEFVVLLDHDDELHPFALLEVARYLNLREDAQLIYSDEDKIDAIGVRSQPAFKPDFDLDMFLSFDYLGHLVALRRSVVSKIGGFRSECDGSQDWDLLIRAVEEIGHSAVHHIPKPLYHWRIHEGSTAFSLDAKPYATKAWSRVLSDHVARTQTSAVPEAGLFTGSMHLRLCRPEGAKIAVIVRAEDGSLQVSTLFSNLDHRCARFYQLVGCALHRLRPTSPVSSSTPSIPKHSREQPDYLLPDGDLISVRSITELEEDVFIFINMPVEIVNHRFFDELTAQAMRDDVGLVTGISVKADGNILHAGFVRGDDGEMLDPFVGLRFPQHGYMGQLSVVRRVEGISYSFFAVRRQFLIGAGGMGIISSAHISRLVSRLLTRARTLTLSVIVTPYAVATFADDGRPLLPIEGQLPSSYPAVRMNPNLARFTDLHEVMRGIP